MSKVVGTNAFNQACTKVKDDILVYFDAFVKAFGTPPMEVGLTDRALLMYKTLIPSLVLRQTGIKEESQNGADYVFELTIQNPYGPLGTGIDVDFWIQAKCFRHLDRDHPVADFCYINKSSGEYQMNILAKSIATADTKVKRAVGGYFVYGPDTIMYIPITDLTKRFANLKERNPGRGSDWYNTELSKFYWGARKQDYFIESLITNIPPI
ncbi:SubName: Full=Uncharacterized protein {ECO:0000313/EMBL:CCA66598.1} [Serendipita indica DSM 11827]|uniref:Uncharacterized protein n=1 Tax=Serendipita indica (strain DSM 11827) TaxID=1109443 RepID=G4T5I0_SERID|nr:SubName: Full=Uncharacterized protein {ECO:0000313/EMBL:CCA66598.1} [Serendipita indica DSM 11827]CCA66598.1 hypothetical protein PIIN_00281 [Serendipita indica DSM 11827]